MSRAVSLALVLVLTLLSGFFDARGFVHAARAWPGGRLDSSNALLSIGSFLLGISFYVAAVRFMQNVGIAGVAVQSAIWFVATAIGVAVMDGSVVQWSRGQQVVGLGIALALTWLIASTAATSGH